MEGLSIDDIQFELEPPEQEPEESSMDGFQFFDDMQMELLDSPQEELQKPMVCQSASGDGDIQMETTFALKEEFAASHGISNGAIHSEPTVPFEEGSEKHNASQTTTNTEIQMEWMIPLKEAEKLIASEAASKSDILSEQMVPLKEEMEKLAAYEANNNGDIQVKPRASPEEEEEKEPEKLGASQATSNNEIQGKPVVPLEEAEKPVASHATSNSEPRVEPMVPLKEVERSITSEPVSDAGLQDKPTVPVKKKATVRGSKRNKPTVPVEGKPELRRSKRNKPAITLQDEAINVVTSQATSGVDIQIEPTAPLKEEPEQAITSYIEPTVPLQEESKNLVASQPTSDANLQPFQNNNMAATFTTDRVFDSREELVKWARDVGQTVGTVIVINKSDKYYPGRTGRIIIGCERGGKYRVAKRGGTKPTRPAGSKRCGCPFQLKGIKMPKDDQWKVTVACGTHNHPTTQNFEGHSYAGKLTSEEKQIVVEMAKDGARPKDVLHALKERNMHNASQMRTIYNVRNTLKANQLSRKSQMQQLLKKVSEHEYVEWHRCHEEDDSVRDLIWAHPESIKLAKCFPHVLLMDCTYKQNRYRPSLLEIVGVTSTNKTFSLAFVYVEAENEENYVWALDCVKSIFSSGMLPSVFVTNRELNLMNAIRRVFPESRNLLCRSLISRDLASSCKKMFDTSEAWDAFLSRCNGLVFSFTEGEYYDRLTALEEDFSQYSDAISYVKETWLSEYKECFIAAWTDQSIHFGITTINRTADNDQTKLRRNLGSSQGKFDTMWSAINSLLLLQHTEINASLDESLTQAMDDYTLTLFEELNGYVSLAALDLILMELKLADFANPEDTVCGCAIRRTHGLPCAHEISRCKYDERPIPLSCIHAHWKTLSLSSVPSISSHHEIYYLPEFQMFCKTYEEADENVKLQLLEMIKEIAMSVGDHKQIAF